MRNWREKQITMGRALALCLMAVVTGAVCCYAAISWRTQAVQVKLRELDRLAADRYVGEMDAEKIADCAALGYLAGLGDQWSSYISAEEYDSYALRSEGKSCGIGTTIVSTGEDIIVYLVCDNSPAQRAGIEKGDRIIAAGGLTVARDGVDAVQHALQGEEGTAISMTVRKAKTGEEQQLVLTRAVFEQKMAWGEMLDGGIGYLRLESFREGSAAQFRAVLDGLLADGAQALVLDVRHNSGGRVREMSEMLDPLLPEGTIMTLRAKNGAETVYTSDADMLDLPVAVLVDDQSISAAEFFAAALQEYERATLVGVHTNGKGRAQRTFRLSDGSAVSLSIEQYYTPRGNSLAGVGIEPDVELRLTDEQLAKFYFLTAQTDPQLQKACEILSDR